MSLGFTQVSLFAACPIGIRSCLIVRLRVCVKASQTAKTHGCPRLSVGWYGSLVIASTSATSGNWSFFSSSAFMGCYAQVELGWQTRKSFWWSCKGLINHKDLLLISLKHWGVEQKGDEHLARRRGREIGLWQGPSLPVRRSVIFLEL